jgi:hypothetical protein
MMYNYPAYSIWSGNSNACLGIPTSQNAVMPTSCTPDDDNSYTGYLGYEAWSTTGSDDDDNAPPAGLIAGVVVGGVVFLAILGCISYFLCCRGGSQDKLLKENNNSSSTATAPHSTAKAEPDARSPQLASVI